MSPDLRISKGKAAALGVYDVTKCDPDDPYPLLLVGLGYPSAAKLMELGGNTARKAACFIGQEVDFHSNWMLANPRLLIYPGGTACLAEPEHFFDLDPASGQRRISVDVSGLDAKEDLFVGMAINKVVFGLDPAPITTAFAQADIDGKHPLVVAFREHFV